MCWGRWYTQPHRRWDTTTRSNGSCVVNVSMWTYLSPRCSARKRRFPPGSMRIRTRSPSGPDGLGTPTQATLRDLIRPGQPGLVTPPDLSSTTVEQRTVLRVELVPDLSHPGGPALRRGTGTTPRPGFHGVGSK